MAKRVPDMRMLSADWMTDDEMPAKRCKVSETHEPFGNQRHLLEHLTKPQHAMRTDKDTTKADADSMDVSKSPS